MKTHRSTQAKVPKKPPPDNHEPFNPAVALESLHTEMVQLETFAHRAGEVVTRLSPPTNRTERRNYVRLYALVTKVADDAITAVRHGDALISALSTHLAVRRSNRASADPDLTAK
jgi:hypothetical protein